MVTSELHTFHLNWKNRNWVTTQRERRKSIKLPLLHCILHLPFGICLPKKQLLKGRKKTFNVYHVHTDLICLQREKANTTIFLSLEIGHKGFFLQKGLSRSIMKTSGKVLMSHLGAQQHHAFLRRELRQWAQVFGQTALHVSRTEGRRYQSSRYQQESLTPQALEFNLLQASTDSLKPRILTNNIRKISKSW